MWMHTLARMDMRLQILQSILWWSRCYPQPTAKHYLQSKGETVKHPTSKQNSLKSRGVTAGCMSVAYRRRDNSRYAPISAHALISAQALWLELLR